METHNLCWAIYQWAMFIMSMKNDVEQIPHQLIAGLSQSLQWCNIISAGEITNGKRHQGTIDRCLIKFSAAFLASASSTYRLYLQKPKEHRVLWNMKENSALNNKTSI